MRPFIRVITEKSVLEAQIARLANKRHPYSKLTVSPGLAIRGDALIGKSAALAKRIKADLIKGPVPSSTPTLVNINLDKMRSIYIFPLVERILHSAAATMLAQWLDPVLPPSLYSYRQKRGPLSAVKQASSYLKNLRKHAKPDVYVLRRDVSNFGPSIPISSESYLWSQLHALLVESGRTKEMAEDVVLLIRELLAGCKDGLPVGSALVPILSNVYLVGFDRYVAKHFECYLRYGDDILAMTTSPEAAKKGSVMMAEQMAQIALRFGEKKALDLVLHPAGIGKEGFIGTSFCEYLGLSIHADGTTTPSKKHMKKFWLAIDTILNLPVAKNFSHNADSLAKFFCLTLARCFSPVSSPFPEIGRVLDVVDNRLDLQNIDYQVALRVAQRATGRRGARAFRFVSYRTLRLYGLPSFVQHKNNRWKNTDGN